MLRVARPYGSSCIHRRFATQSQAYGRPIRKFSLYFPGYQGTNARDMRDRFAPDFIHHHFYFFELPSPTGPSES